jgi:hypothetical protein
VTNASTPLYVVALNSKQFAITGGKRYACSLMTKTEGLDNRGVWLLMRWYNEGGRLIDTAPPIPMLGVTGTNLTWRKDSATLTVPAKAVKAMAEVRAKATKGIAYIDDIVCTPAP